MVHSPRDNMKYTQTAVRGWSCVILFILITSLLWYLDPTGPHLTQRTPASSQPARRLQGTEAPSLRRHRRDNHILQHHDHTENLWWQVANLSAHKLTNDSCYVCGLVPHATPTQSVFIPYPVPLNTTLWTLIMGNRLHPRNITWPHQRPPLSWRRPAEFSSNTNSTCVSSRTVFRLRDRTNPYSSPPLCFQRNGTDALFFLGHTLGCQRIISASCISSPCPKRSDPFTLNPRDLFPDSSPSTEWGLGVVVFNLTALLPFPDLPMYNNSVLNTIWSYIPSDTGFGCPQNMVWTCGRHSYIYLPVNWSGTCYLAYLLPDVSAFTLTPNGTLRPFPEPFHHPHRVKRGIFSPQMKGFMMALPWWGVGELAWTVEDLSISLQNLTSLVDSGFSLLQKEVQALRIMSLQNRMALDFLLAAQGGTCALIGDQCCTFVPDTSTNLSVIHDALTDLWDTLHDRNNANLPSKGWDFWNWLTSGSWILVLTRVATLLAIFLLCVLVVFCCVLPLIKCTLNRTFNFHVHHYTPEDVTPYYDSGDLEFFE
ncbi:endogenous retrovirus group PABLB member 1 Env polyprotein-like isoform X1 [Melanotaenia boesemani]|uniref:endogenous retrovirus group PABLB member 1 Env polyprotein-like isoform X1 n=1 Tax=Melanotaenia boesemani TaxID=1250792 RepID=UPI001C05BD81|nr:endogenous retrovirus group PABLB member 1 Env polyprotein-like isoform X1 [Melanotaenia boesemani]XP_041856077.1 endogenous retrovirus group PABLB member 1 Env polyprotein-like isoform X1 [Melanotaenia boesemani]XP_041856078.1 endogenous retrovirus group PABLB member 1 Env polyprotein-like isoform X1 [Melanotaenia boesemani]